MGTLASVQSSTLMRALINTYWRAVVRQVAAVGTERVLYEHARRNSQRIRTAISPEGLAEIRRIVDSGGTDVAGDRRHLDAPASLTVESLLREARWQAFQSLPHRYQDREQRPVWTDGMRAAVADALVTAASHRAERPHGGHLLLGLFTDPDSGASRLLRAAGVDRVEVIRSLSTADRLRQEAAPWLPGVELLQFTGLIANDKVRAWERPIHFVLTRILGWMASGLRRAHGHGSPVAACLQTESVRQAVVLDGGPVRPRHVVLAILSTDDQLAAAGQRLPGRIAGHSTAAALLAEHAVTYRRVVGPAADLEAEAAETVPEAPALINAPDEPETPQSTAAAAAVWATARAHADRLGHTHTGTTHVLLALLEDPSGETARLLRACEADPALVCEQALASLAASTTA